MAVIKGTSNIPTSSGGGSSSNAKQLYKHIIKLDLGLLGTFIEITNDSDTAFTIATLQTYLHNNGFIDQQNLYPVISGHYRDTNSNTDYSCLGVFELENTLQCSSVQNGVNSTTYKKINTLVKDKVIAL